MKPLTAKECLKLRNKAKSEIERLESISQDVKTMKLLDDFKNKFNMCESAYKIVLFEHQKAKGNAKEMKDLTINMQQVPHALKFAGYHFCSKLLKELFGCKSNNKGCTTVKVLRDSITHSINETSVNEIKNRSKELFGYMNTFLNGIKNFDNKEDEKIK